MKKNLSNEERYYLRESAYEYINGYYDSKYDVITVDELAYYVYATPKYHSNIGDDSHLSIYLCNKDDVMAYIKHIIFSDSDFKDVCSDWINKCPVEYKFIPMCSVKEEYMLNPFFKNRVFRMLTSELGYTNEQLSKTIQDYYNEKDERDNGYRWFIDWLLAAIECDLYI